MVDSTEIVWVEATLGKSIWQVISASARVSQAFEDCLMGRLVIRTSFSSTTFQVETFTEPNALGDSVQRFATWPGALDFYPFEQVYCAQMDKNPFLGI